MISDIITPTLQMAVWVTLGGSAFVLAMHIQDVCGWRFWRCHEHMIMFGRFMFLVATAINFLFWWLPWLLRARGNDEASSWFRANVELIWPVLAMILAAAVLSIGPQAAPVVGRRWPILAVLVMAVILSSALAVTLQAAR